MSIDIYYDGASIEDIKKYSNYDYIQGFTTNPTLIKKAGITNYIEFIEESLKYSNNKPISFEVLSDNDIDMIEQGIKISNNKNAWVKIPIVHKDGTSTKNVIKKLIDNNVNINITCVMCLEQIKEIIDIFRINSNIIISIFAGRVADTLRDPELIIKDIRKYLKNYENIRILWASGREIYNLVQAKKCGCDIITLSKDFINKLKLKNKDLIEYSKETVQMFMNDCEGIIF